MRTEVWRSSLGIYEVSNFGRVRNSRTGRVLRHGIDKGGYPFVILTVEKRRINKKAHALVASAFIGPRPYKHDVNHKNGVKTANRPGNLEYATRGSNLKHAFANGLKTHVGESNPQNKYTESQIKQTKVLLATGMAQKAIAAEVQIPLHVVVDVKRGRTWAHI